jgi:hypothetical protein
MRDGSLGKIFIGGIVVIGLVTAVGLHAEGLSQVTSKAGTASQGLLSTAESGKS